jgi:hypothetical protein
MERRVSEMHELDVAKAIAAGELPSPTRFHNSTYYKVRVSRTGCAWREQHKEFCYRSPEIWLSDEMCQRVCGLPLIAEHPLSATLDGPAFYQRIVGILVFGFPEGSDLMGIARVIDEQAAAIIESGNWDTSPSVAFELGQNLKLKAGDDTVLIEENPAQLDHLALVNTEDGRRRGVWNRAKDGGDLGVELTEG